MLKLMFFVVRTTNAHIKIDVFESRVIIISCQIAITRFYMTYNIFAYFLCTHVPSTSITY